MFSKLLKEIIAEHFPHFLCRQWRAECRTKAKPSFCRAVAKAFWFEIFVMGILNFIIEVASRPVMPYLLDRFLSFFQYDFFVSTISIINQQFEILFLEQIQTCHITMQ